MDVRRIRTVNPRKNVMSQRQVIKNHADAKRITFLAKTRCVENQ